MTEKHTVTVEGATSGDMECWCLRVDEETYQAVKGECPYCGDTGWAEDGLGGTYRCHDCASLMLYPSDLIKAEGRVRLTILVEKLGD